MEKRLYLATRQVRDNRIVILTLFVLTSLLWPFTLLLFSGDVEVNPGPDSVEGTLNNSSDDVSVTSFELLSNHFSIIHLNIQSIVPKMDIIKSEADSYGVLLFSESWL